MGNVRGEVLRRRATWFVILLVVFLLAVFRTPVRATMKMGSLELSGNVETQNIIRDPSGDKLQFVQGRNTARIRVDWDWLQNGRLMDKFNTPWIERSKLFLLYRGVYDDFYDIAPTDLQLGQSRFDDVVGGPISGPQVGTLQSDGSLKQGRYSRLDNSQRSSLKFENTLREAYVDLKLAKAPVSFRLGRQQVIWGESDQFRLMDIWNPLDVTWHFQQESWDNIRIPLWLGKGLWDIGDLGPLSNTFMEVVYNPFDFQNNAKLQFLPQPWALPFANPLRNGQVQQIIGSYYATSFNLEGTSLRKGAFERNPAGASEAGARFHFVTPQGLELSANYMYARARGVGANGPVGVKINSITLFPHNGAAPLGSVHNPGNFVLDNGMSSIGSRLGTVQVDAQTQFPYNNIFGLTGNYFEGDFTNAVLRFETAYVTNEPYQTVEQDKLGLSTSHPAKDENGRPGTAIATAPLGYDKRDSWAGMIGFDRPTWIRPLNSKTTWFLTGQFFWSYLPGQVSTLRNNSGAGDTPYFTPEAGLPGSKSQGVGVWTTGPYAGTVERLQSAALDPSGAIVRRWENLVTLAATSFYRGGTIVPFVADAWDFNNNSNEALWNVDYFYTNNFIITVGQKFFMLYGGGSPSNDPWFAGGRFVRRDESFVKLTYQF